MILKLQIVNCTNGKRETKFISEKFMLKQVMLMKALTIPKKVTYYMLYYKTTALLVTIIVTKQRFITELCLMGLCAKTKNLLEKISKDRLTVLCCSNSEEVIKCLFL